MTIDSAIFSFMLPGGSCTIRFRDCQHFLCFDLLGSLAYLIILASNRQRVLSKIPMSLWVSQPVQRSSFPTVFVCSPLYYTTDSSTSSTTAGWWAEAIHGRWAGLPLWAVAPRLFVWWWLFKARLFPACCQILLQWMHAKTYGHKLS